jgi:hypothetical protein
MGLTTPKEDTNASIAECGSRDHHTEKQWWSPGNEEKGRDGTKR